MKKLFLAALVPFTVHARIELIDETPHASIQATFLALKGSYEQVSGRKKEAARTYKLLSYFTPESKPLEQAQVKLAFETANFCTIFKQKDAIAARLKHDKESALYLAQTYMLTGKHDQALTLLQKLFKAYPHDERMSYTLANALLKMKKLDEAGTLLDRILAEGSGKHKRYLFHFLRAKVSFFRKDNDEAISHINHALRLAPRFVKGLLLKGLILEQAGDKKGALCAYVGYTAHTKDKQIEKKIISLAFATHSYDTALTFLEKNKEETADCHYDRGLLLFKLGKYEPAYEAIVKSLEKQPDYAKSRILLIHVFLSAQEHDLACKQLAHWLEKEPYDVKLLRTLSQLDKRGVPAEKIIETMTTLATNSPTYVTCFGLGDKLLAHKKYDEACVWYKRALSDDALREKSLLYSQIAFQCATAYYRAEDFTQCTQILTRSLACKPVYPSAYNLQALLLLRKDRFNHALKAIDKALLSEPQHAPFLDTKGMILFKQGKKKQAHTLIKKAHNLDPKDATIALHLGLFRTF